MSTPLPPFGTGEDANPLDSKGPALDHHEKPPQRHHRRRFIYWLLVFILLIIMPVLIWHFTSHNNSTHKRALAQPIPVTIAIARKSDIPVYLSALGAVTPTYNVTVRTQVNGRLLRVLFKEGQMVKANDLLAEIDPRSFQAQLLQFQGELQRDTAQLANAQVDLKRYKILYPVGAASKQTYDTQASLVKQLQGTVKFDQGQIDAVKVNLAYCEITSPVNGRVGLRLVDPGNFVQTSDVNGLVVVNTIKPITVVFSLPEDDVPKVMAQFNTGKTLQVEAYDRDLNMQLATGTLLAVDNEVDPATGTIKLKALFPNENNNLFPSQFVNVKLLVDTLHHVTVVPIAAVEHGPKGPFVFLLNQHNIVSVKSVTVGVTEAYDIVILNGVLPGQQVVVEGAEKLTDGATVRVSSPTKFTLPVPIKNQSSLHGAAT